MPPRDPWSIEEPKTAILKAAHRLNPVMDLELDLVAVKRGVMCSTQADWNAGTKTNVTVDADGSVRLTEGAAVTLFESSAGSGSATVKHQLASAITSGAEQYWLDFFPDPSVVTVPFTLKSIALVLGRRSTSAQVAFGATNILTEQSPAYIFRLTFAIFDDRWRRIPIGDPVDITSGVGGGQTTVTLDLRSTDLQRTITIHPGTIRTSTGSGRTSAGAERTAAATTAGNKTISHLVVARGFSIGIDTIGENHNRAFVGCIPNATAAQFDTTAFWRSAANRNHGPYDPVSASVFPPSDTAHNTDRFLLTGAVPGYGARATATLFGGGATPTGTWGIARSVRDEDVAQWNDATLGTWEQPYHSVKAVSYASSGTMVRTFDLGAAPTTEVHLRISDYEPKGTEIQYTLRRSTTSAAGPWTAMGVVVDGQVLTGADAARYYELTATFTPGPSGATKLATPVLQEVSFTERVRYGTHRYTADLDASVSADPVTGESEIAQLKVALHRGGRRDFRDLATEVATLYAPSQVEAWVYAVHRRDATKRLFLNSYRLENREPSETDESMTFLAGMDRLKVKIPQKSETYSYTGAVNTTSRAGTTQTVTVTGTPFTVSSPSNYRIKFTSGNLSGGQFRLLSFTTTSAFTFTTDSSVDVPVAGDTFEIHSDAYTRVPVVYAGQDLAAIYEDVLVSQAQVPSRFRGVLPATTGRLASGTLASDGKEALAVLREIALLSGGIVTWQGGKIDFVDVYGAKESLAIWDERHYVSLTTGLGADRRIPSIRVRYNYDAAAQAFGNESVYDDYQGVTAWGRPNLYDIYELPDEVCRWISTADDAKAIGLRYLEAWSTGVRLWKVETGLAWPWLRMGDAVTVVTDQYTDRRFNFAADGITDRGTVISGRIAAVGVIVGKNLWGTEWLLAVRGQDAITSAVPSTGSLGGTAPAALTSAAQISVTGTTATARLTMANPFGAITPDTLRLYRGGTVLVSAVTRTAAAGATQDLTDSGPLEPSTAYSYEACAVASGVEGPRTSLTMTTAAATIDAPVLSYEVFGSNAQTLTWVPGTNTPSGTTYDVESNTGAGYTIVIDGAGLSGTTWSGVPEVAETYRVIARKTGWTASAYSNVVTPLP